MSHNDARPVVGMLFCRLGLAGILALILTFPAVWLRWEAAEAHARAVLLTDAASLRARYALRDLFARFERATASLRAQDLAGDTVSLTGRLLRVEPLIAPATGLQVVNSRGLFVASSSVGVATVGTPIWWFRALPLPQTHQAIIVGCGTASPDASGWVVARGIEGTQDAFAGEVGSLLPAAALRALTAPNGDNTSFLDYGLRDGDNCELLRVAAAVRPAEADTALVRLYRALLPARWLMPEPATATVTAGNLTWIGTVSPEAALSLRAAAIRQHAGIVLWLTIALGGLTLLVVAGLTFSGQAISGRRVGRRVRRADALVDPDMEDLRGKLDEMVGERDPVLAAIGHDVRTPMNPILGICALLLDGDLDEAQRKWLWRIRASCEALLAMLNGMLEIAAAGVDGAEIHREAIDVASLVEEVADVLRPQAEDKGLELLVVIEASVAGIWNTDSTRLRQVLFNLCGNAIKYTSAGSVEVRALTERDKAGVAQLRLRVSDTGPGVAADEREVIFEQFRRGRHEASRAHEGLGLGLALCREIATLLGGHLSLDSVEDVGSVFTFEIPVERGSVSGACDGPLAGRTALVVGLSEGVRRRVASHLESIGFEVETAGDGFMAVGLAERIAFQRGTLDLMVLDAALTGLSADALLARFKASRPLEHLRTVLVVNGTDTDQTGDQTPDQRGDQTGCRADAVVPHPVETRDLDHIVAGFFGARSSLREVDPHAPATPRARVLVVEDNRIAQALFVDQLNRAGFSTFSASNGREAVEAARRGGFDAILMDVQMPEIDGTEATRRIRADERPQRVPIIGMTAHTGSIIRRRCLDAGMDLVLHKPVDFSSLPLRLREVIAARSVAAAPGSEIIAEPAPDSALEIEDEYLEILLAEVGAKRARIYVTAFLADTAVHISTMAHLRDDGDAEELGRLAHSLAGIAGTLGALTLADGLLMLEDAVRLTDPAHVDAALTDVRSTWERTRKMLRPRFEALASGRGGSAAPKAA